MSNANNTNQLAALEQEREELIKLISGGTIQGQDLDDAKSKLKDLESEIDKLKAGADADDAPTADAEEAEVEAEEAEAHNNKTLIAIAIGLVVVLITAISIVWVSSSKDEAVTATAASAKYFTSLEEVKQSFETSMFRTWDMEYSRRAEALQTWVPSYRALYIECGLTSSKEEALMYSYGLAVSLYMEKGAEPADAYRQAATSSIEELKELLKENDEDCEAVLKALQ